MDWKYISSHEEDCKGIIDMIYCSNVDLNIPIQYSWTILFKNGTEVDLFENYLVFLNPIDKSAFNQATTNALLLLSKR